MYQNVLQTDSSSSAYRRRLVHMFFVAGRYVALGSPGGSTVQWGNGAECAVNYVLSA